MIVAKKVCKRCRNKYSRFCSLKCEFFNIRNPTEDNIKKCPYKLEHMILHNRFDVMRAAYKRFSKEYYLTSAMIEIVCSVVCFFEFLLCIALVTDLISCLVFSRPDIVGMFGF